MRSSSLFGEMFARNADPCAPLPFIDGLHAAQRRLVDDPSRFKAGLCGRRGGKTWGVACDLLAGAEANPDETSVYVALTKAVARRNLGKALMRIQKQFGVDGRLGEQDGQLQWIHHNGHRIWLAGCKHLSEAEKFRGDYYTQVVIDEGHSYPLGLLEYMINDAFAWALVDKQAPLTVTGTPGALPIGYFHDITVGTDEVPAWPTYSWTMYDNPAILDPQAELELRMKRTGETTDSPGIQREFFARWVKDEDAIIYPYLASRNACWDVPKNCDRWVLSIDLGHDDDTTFTISGSRRDAGKVWLKSSYGKTEMTTAERAAEVKRNEKQMAEFTGNRAFRFSAIVVDTGGLGKSICHDMATDYGINCHAAEKSQKAAAIRNLKAAILTGRAMFHPTGCNQLIGEMGVLPWNLMRTDHHGEFADHCCDGALYGYREHPTREKWDEERPDPGTPEFYNQQMVEYRAKLIRQKMQADRATSRQVMKKLGSGRRYS